MLERARADVALRAIVSIVVFSAAPLVGVHAQAAGASAATLAGVVSATTTKGDTVRVPNVVVHLWRGDSATVSVRDSACAAWRRDRFSWIGARQELISPSGAPTAGTQVGRDLEILSALAATPHDTVRTGPDGTFAFRGVTPGTYTVEAEAYANDTFMQWASDVTVQPGADARVALSSAVFSENQFCGPATRVASDGRVYGAAELDRPLTVIADGWNSYIRNLSLPLNTDATIEFVVDAAGVPEVNSISIHGAPSLDFERATTAAITRLRFEPPRSHGTPVRTRVQFRMRGSAEIRRMPIRG